MTEDRAPSPGVAKSSVSEEAIAASEKEFKRLGERRFDEVDIMKTETASRSAGALPAFPRHPPGAAAHRLRACATKRAERRPAGRER